jgi:hypothetical protein
MVRWPVEEAARVLLWLSQWNNAGPRARSCQSTPSRWIQGDSVVSTHAKGRFDLGAAVVGMHAQRHRQGPGQQVEAAIGTLACGLLLWAPTRRFRRELQPRDGCLLVVLTWVSMASAAMVPFLMELPGIRGNPVCRSRCTGWSMAPTLAPAPTWRGVRVKR